MTCEEARLAAVTLLKGIEMTPNAETKIAMVGNVMRSIGARHMKAGIVIGIGATLIAAIIFGLFLRWV